MLEKGKEKIQNLHLTEDSLHRGGEPEEGNRRKNRNRKGTGCRKQSQRKEHLFLVVGEGHFAKKGKNSGKSCTWGGGGSGNDIVQGVCFQPGGLATRMIKGRKKTVFKRKLREGKTFRDLSRVCHLTQYRKSGGGTCTEEGGKAAIQREKKASHGRNGKQSGLSQTKRIRSRFC